MAGDFDHRVEVPGGQGVQVGNRNIQLNTYIREYVERQVVQAPPGPVVWPVRVGDVPQQPPAFQLRADLLAALGERGLGVSVAHAVTGMRGVGKTQVAAAYARARMDEGWRLVAWVDAEDNATVLDGLGEVAARLGLCDSGEDLQRAAARVRNWLEADGRECLLVFDNVMDLDGLRRFLPAAGDAQVVITSSRQAAADLGRAVPVDVFSEPEALAFLAERTGRHDSAGAEELAAELGRLPLALAQAAGVIARQRLDYDTYLARLRSLRVDDYLVRAVGDPYPCGVAAGVLLSLDSACALESGGVAGAVMDLVAVLSVTGVSRALLYAASQGAVKKETTIGEREAVVVDAALDQLADASLVTFSMDGSTVRAHRLVMRVVRELRMREGRLAAVGATAVGLLWEARQSLGPVWHNPEAARDLIQQVSGLHEHLAPFITEADCDLGEALLELRGWTVWCLNEMQDSPARAIEYGQQLAADCQRILGTDDPRTLTARNNLAVAYESVGQQNKAISLYEQNLADWERVLGTDYPETLAARNSLSGAYAVAGRLDEAIPLYERTLADRERAQGADHPGTLQSRNDLAFAYRLARQPEQAIPLLKGALAGFERILGTDDPLTLMARNNLAGAYQSVGQQDEAISLYERNLANRERVLGTDHPETLASRVNLAGAYATAGRVDEAIQPLEQALADFERLLGPEHPETMASRNNLAFAYQSAGRPGKAIPLYERNLAYRERALSTDHPDALRSRNNLASAYQSAGRPGKAIPLYERNLADTERVLGADHPETLTARNNLAFAYRSAGRLKETIPLLQRSLTEYKRVLGASHPETMTVRHNLADVYTSAGRASKAVPLYERNLGDCKRVLGIDHPNTLTARANLAGAYVATRRAGKAIPLYERNLADTERVLGADHPDTLASRNNLAGAYVAAGRLIEAIPLYQRVLADCKRIFGVGHPLTLAVQKSLLAAKRSMK